MTEKTCVLVLEHLPADAERCEREIGRALSSCEFRRVESRKEYIAALKESWPSIIIADLSLPRFDGLTALRLAQERVPHVPFIVLTGSTNEDTAVECLKAGAWDYVIKEHMKRLGPAVRNALKRRKARLAQHAALERERLAAQILEMLNQSVEEVDVVRQILLKIKAFSGIEAAGLRLKEGDDYPYYESNGFPQDFVRAETYLCARDRRGEPTRDSAGEPVLECMCGNIIRGRTDPSFPFFTRGGSFWTNCTTELLASTSETDRQTRTRNRCNTEGYESVALIPLRSSRGTIGLLQLNDRRKRVFTPEMIAFYEGIGAAVGIAISRRRAEEELRESETRYRTLFDDAQDGIALADAATGTLVDCNLSLCRMVERSRTELVGHAQTTLHPPEEVTEGASATFRQHQADPGSIVEARLLSKSGKVIPVEIRAARVRMSGREFLLGIFRDITERKQLEEQFRQSQKLEAVGRLAGGLAHDFDNILTVLIGHCDLMKPGIGTDHPLAENLAQIEASAERAAALTRQLLAFSRRQTLQPKVLDLNALVRNLDKMLRRLIGEDIEFLTKCAGDLGCVVADPGQIEQVVTNLAVNARDAMPDGGMLTIETANVELDAEYSGEHVSVIPGRYVMLAVSDTGCGMDEKTRGKIFEPFFTTKEKGKGTGLGLSTVYGIVKQSGGNIWVYSEPGQGATFKMYLPRTDARPEPAEKLVEEKPGMGQGEHVLVVEDEPALQNLFERMLKNMNYRVSIAVNGDEALTAVEKDGVRPDLLITDVVMPGMSGVALVERLRKNQPKLKVLFMSGYTEEAIVHHGILDPGIPFIQKPFNISDLAAKINMLLRENRAKG